MGTVATFTIQPKVSAVPTAVAGETRSSRINNGVVMLPAPTPVNEMAIAMTKPSRNSMLAFLMGLGDVDAAFQFAAGPTSRAGIFRIGRKGCAGLAADARIAKIVERQQGNIVL